MSEEHIISIIDRLRSIEVEIGDLEVLSEGQAARSRLDKQKSFVRATNWHPP